MTWEVRVGDCRVLMAQMEENSIDSIVCDPPYGLSKEPDMAEVLRHWLAGDDYVHTGSGFMGKSWDSFVPGPAIWKEAYRVLKPGGHLIAFFGTRTYDLGAIAIRLAGFECRDMGQYAYGSGFPKSHDLQKAFLKLEDEENAEKWKGYGTSLKPAFEPWILARKPLDGTVAGNVVKHGVGGLNIDGCRVGDEVGGWGGAAGLGYHGGCDPNGGDARPIVGRFPANLIHDGSDEVLALFPHTKSGYTDGTKSGVQQSTFGKYGAGTFAESYGDEGSAARFFYTAKASQWDRNGGLDDLDDKPSAASEFRPNHAEKAAMGEDGNPYGRWSPRKNIHPTVKPTDLMRYLCRLVTPPGGLVLDPFTGSGSTGRAALLEGFSFIGCELSEEYAEIARGRIAYVERNKDRALIKPKPVEHNPYKIDLF